jgi:hypothetical protein
MNLRELGMESVYWINLAQDRDQWWGLMSTVINLRSPLNKAGNFVTSLVTSSFTIKVLFAPWSK